MLFDKSGNDPSAETGTLEHIEATSEVLAIEQCGQVRASGSGSDGVGWNPEREQVLFEVAGTGDDGEGGTSLPCQLDEARLDGGVVSMETAEQALVPLQR